MYQPIKSSLQKQLKKLVPLILLIALPPVALIIFLAASSVIYEIPIDHFSRDPLAILDGPLYLGLLSNLGALLWCSVATLALFTYASVRGQVDPQAARFLLAGGTITALFCLDDLFMLHEKVLPTLFSLPEHFTCAVYFTVGTSANHQRERVSLAFSGPGRFWLFTAD